MNPNGPAVRAKIEAELEARGRVLSPELLDAATTLIVGFLRRSIPPTKELEPEWQDQAIAWLVVGLTRVPTPSEQVGLPQDEAMLKSLFQQAGEAVPSDAVRAMLADIASYAIHRETEPTPGYGVVALNLIAESFRDGRNPPWR